MEILLQLFNVVTPVFVAAGIGYVLAKRGEAFDTSVTTMLVTNVGTPCLIFNVLADVSVTPDALASMGLASFIAIAIFGTVGFVALKGAGQDVRAFLPAIMFTNCGNVGLPLCLLAFGEAGLALAVVYFAVSATLMFTVGAGLASGSMTPSDLVKMPFLWATAAALVFLIAGIEPPKVVMNTTEMLGGLTIPLMLIALGISLANLKVTSLPRSLSVSLLRLLLGFGVGLGVAHVMELDKLATGVLVLQCSLPVAVFNYLFAHRYNHHPEEVAGTVVLSTGLSFATLPALIWFLL